MDIAREIFFKDLMFFIGCNISDVVSSKKLLHREMDKVEGATLDLHTQLLEGDQSHYGGQ